VVAIGRQLMVDLWRLQTGRVSAQELNLVAIPNANFRPSLPSVTMPAFPRLAH
jgi:hypothetical protein